MNKYIDEEFKSYAERKKNRGPLGSIKEFLLKRIKIELGGLLIGLRGAKRIWQVYLMKKIIRVYI